MQLMVFQESGGGGNPSQPDFCCRALCLKHHVSLCGELAPPLVFSTIFYHLIINVGFFITRIGNFRNQKGQFWPNLLIFE